MNNTAKGIPELSHYTFNNVKPFDKHKNNEPSLQLKIDQLEKHIDKLETLNKAKDRLLAIISHDLKNSFSALLGTTQILLEDSSTMSEEGRLLLINELNKASQNAYYLLENLLSYASRSEGLNLKTYLEVINLNEIVEESVKLQNCAAIKKNIEITNNITAETRILSDKFMLNTVLRNLINNAVKFTDNGGQIILNFMETDEFAEIIVQDTGKGMSEEVISKILSMNTFYTSAGTNGESGSGLGIKAALGFIEKMEGMLLVESKPGFGSKFKLRFAKNKT